MEQRVNLFSGERLLGEATFVVSNQVPITAFEVDGVFFTPQAENPELESVGDDCGKTMYDDGGDGEGGDIFTADSCKEKYRYPVVVYLGVDENTHPRVIFEDQHGALRSENSQNGFFDLTCACSVTSWMQLVTVEEAVNMLENAQEAADIREKLLQAQTLGLFNL